MFICGGVFVGLDKVISDWLEKSGIGFFVMVKSKDDICNVGEILKDVEFEDLVCYGLILEFVGCLLVFVMLEELDEEVLM